MTIIRKIILGTTFYILTFVLGVIFISYEYPKLAILFMLLSIISGIKTRHNLDKWNN